MADAKLGVGTGAGVEVGGEYGSSSSGMVVRRCAGLSAIATALVGALSGCGVTHCSE